jgi:hypothetical protein
MHFRRHTLGEISALKSGDVWMPLRIHQANSDRFLCGRHNCGVARSGGKPNTPSINTVLFFLDDFQSFNKAEYLVSQKGIDFSMDDRNSE